ncbi:MAG: phosphopyruvate hydratase, partial [Halobacteriaceae archaeon]
MTQIQRIRLREILDSRGDRTVEADVLTENGGFGRASAPSGASTGEFEAIELDPAEAIAAAREKAVPRLEGSVYAGDQRSVDATLRAADGTDNLSEIGANATVAISMATAKSAADVLGTPLYQHLGGAFRGDNWPTPLGNIIGGGEHARDATDIQEFLVAPIGAPTIRDAAFANAAVHARVKEILVDRGYSVAKGDEGAWAPSIPDEEAFDIVLEATDDVGEEFGFEIRLGIDVAASELYDGSEYVYSDTNRTPGEQVEYIQSLIDEYNLLYVEDPLEERDFEGFADLTRQAPEQTLICGDDLFVTNTNRLEQGLDIGAANSILIKPNQIGTLSDTIDAIELALRNAYTPVISHRSGESEDAT